MASRTLAIGGFGALTLGYGAYFLGQQKEVSRLERDVSDIAAVVQKEKSTVEKSAKALVDTEQVGSLQPLRTQRAHAQSWWLMHSCRQASRPLSTDHPRPQPLTVGYLSGSEHDHAVP